MKRLPKGTSEARQSRIDQFWVSDPRRKTEPDGDERTLQNSPRSIPDSNRGEILKKSETTSKEGDSSAPDPRPQDRTGLGSKGLRRNTDLQ